MKKILASLLTVAMIATLVPFAAFAEETVDTSFVFGTGSYGSFRSQGIPGVQIGGIGGKAQDDLSMAFVVDSDFNGQESRWQYPTTHISADAIGSGGTKGMYCSFNMYADGDTVVGVGYGSNLSAILKWEADGTLTYNIEKVNHTIMLERGKWHKVVISVCEGVGQRVGLFIDGVLLSTTSDLGWSGWASKTPFLFGVPATSGTGTVAFDDPYLTLWTDYNTYGKTMKANDVAIAANTDSLTFDTEAKTISLNHYPESYAAFVASVAEGFTNETEIRILTEDMSAVATTVEDAKIALVKTINNAYDYYTFNEYVKTDVEKVGLSKVKDDSSIAGDNWKSNIIIVKDKIAVYSSTLRNLSWIDSTRLLGGLVSNNGYILSYVDENKNPATASNVTDGYVKASKDGEEDIYIEIVNKYNHQGPLEVTDWTVDKRASTLTSATGIAGKPSDDTSSGFLATTYTGETPSQAEPKYYFKEDAVISTHPDGTRTYVFNMYVDGDAIARIGMMYGTSAYYVMKWEGATGDFYAPASGTSMSSTPEFKLETGRWHQIAISMDKGTGGKVEIYIDGVLYQKGIDDNHGWNNYQGIALGAYCFSTTGKVLYDDIETYNGFYDAEDANVAVKSVTSNFIIDKDNKVIYYKNMTTPSEIVSAVIANTNASTAKVYADNTFASEATTLDNNSNVVVLTSPNVLRYEYYTLKAYSEIPAPEFAFDLGETTFTVSAKIKADYTGSTIYVATYTSDNTLVAVTPIALDASDYNTEFSQKFAYGSGGQKVKVFLWDGEQNPVSYAEADRPAE